MEWNETNQKQKREKKESNNPKHHSFFFETTPCCTFPTSSSLGPNGLAEAYLRCRDANPLQPFPSTRNNIPIILSPAPIQIGTDILPPLRGGAGVGAFRRTLQSGRVLGRGVVLGICEFEPATVTTAAPPRQVPRSRHFSSRVQF